MVANQPTCCVLDIPASEAATDCPLYGLHECRYIGETMSRPRRNPHWIIVDEEVGREPTRSAPPRQRHRHSRQTLAAIHPRRMRSERRPSCRFERIDLYWGCKAQARMKRQRLRDADAADATDTLSEDEEPDWGLWPTDIEDVFGSVCNLQGLEYEYVYDGAYWQCDWTGQRVACKPA